MWHTGLLMETSYLRKCLKTEGVSAFFFVNVTLPSPFLPFNLPSSWFLPSGRLINEPGSCSVSNG